MRRNLILTQRVPVDIYNNYYKRQAGGAYDYERFEGIPYQRGHGFGSFFRGLFRFIKPILTSNVVKSGAKALAKQAAASGAQLMGDIAEGHNLRDSMRQRAEEGGRSLAATAKSKLEQYGSGRRRKRRRVSRKKASHAKGPARKKSTLPKINRRKRRSLKTVF